MPEQQLALRESGEIAAAAPMDVLSLVMAAAKDPTISVDKMNALLDFKERIDAVDARRAYTAAMAAMSAELPRIKKDGTIDLGSKGKIPFATWEQIDAVIRPILRKHGFTLNFPTRVESGQTIMACVVSHIAGHSERSETVCKPDPGPGRNETQSGGSGRSYAKRYLTKDMLNIVTEGADDDGKGSGFISTDEAKKVHDLMMALELDQPRNAAQRKAFFKFAGVEVVEHIQRYDLERVLTALRSKLREKEQGK